MYLNIFILGAMFSHPMDYVFNIISFIADNRK